MAIDPRPPGDVSVKTRYNTFKWRIALSGTSLGSLKWEPWNSSQQAIFRSWRPSYPKGTVITLPGGTTFRKSTAYSHRSLETSVSGMFDGAYNFYRGEYRGAQDYGREIGFLIESPAIIRGITIPTDARNEAVTKALTEIADQKVNLGENLATMGQTVRLFAGAAKTLADSLHYARRVKSWRKWLNKTARDFDREGPITHAASSYLAYIYGLKPLVNDVYTLAQLVKEQGQTSLLFSGQGKATRFETLSASKPISLSYSRFKREQGSGTYKVKCKLWGQIDPNAAGLRSLNQLGLLNPFGLAWDLVPYSFVVDWLIPVGPVLYALTAPMGLKFVDGTISMRSSETISYDWYVHSTAYLNEAKDKPPQREQRLKPTTSYEGYTRQVLTSWPLPGYWFDRDPFRADRSIKAAALSIMALSGSRPPIR